MAQGLTFTITAEDQSGRVISQAGANLSAAFDRIQKQADQMAAASTSATAKMITGLQQLSQQGTVTAAGQGALGKALLQTGQAAGVATAQIKQFQQAAASAHTTTSTFATSVKAVATGFGLFAGIAGVVGIVKQVASSFLDNALAMDTVRLSLAGVTGSTAAAGKELENIQAIAEKTGLGVALLSQQWTGLYAAVSQTPGRLDLARESFSALIETGARLGKSTAQIGAALYGLQQLAGGATVQLDELQKQMGDALPGLFPALAREMGFTVQEFRNLISEGKILVDDVLAKMPIAIKSLTSGEGSIRTATSEFGRMATAWTNLMDALAQSGALAVVTTGVKVLTGALVGLGAAIRDTTAAFAGAGQATVVTNSMKQIQQQIEETGKSIQNIEGAATTGVGGLVNKALGLDQGPALEAQKKRLEDLKTAYGALEQSLKNLQSTEGQGAPALSASEKARAKLLTDLKDLKKTSAETQEAIGKLNLELGAVRSKDVEQLRAVGLDPLSKTFPQEQKAAETRILKARQDLQDKLLGIDRKAGSAAAKEAGQSAVEIAKAHEDALATGLKNEITLIKQSADERRRIADETATAELMAEGPGAVEAIARRRSEIRKTIALEEAQALEKIELDGLNNRAEARAAVLTAEIAAAGKNTSAAVAAQAELNNLEKETAAQRVGIQTETAKVLQGISKKSVDEQLKDARELNKLIQETEQERVQARINLGDEQIALINAQVDGEVITVQQGYEQIRTLQQQRFDDLKLLYTQQADAAILAIDAEVAASATGQAQILKIRAGLNDQLEALDVTRATQQQEFLNKQHADFVRFRDRVQDTLSNFLVDLFEGQIKSISDLFNSLKASFFRMIADMIARLAAAPIAQAFAGIIGGIAGGFSPTLGQALLGSVGLGTGGGIAGAGGTGGGGIGTLQGLGLLASLKTIGGGFVNALDGLTGTLVSAGSTISQAIGGPAILTAGQVGQASTVGAGTAGAYVLPGAALSAAGGLAALGGGIYAAINASNAASKAAFAASAAAGAAATATAAIGAGLLGASAATAVGTGWTGIGLIVAAVMAVIGVVLDKVIKPAGPSLSVRTGGGLNVGTADGRLQVQGDLGSRVTRREGVDRGMAQQVQAQLEEGITAAVMSIVQTINAVALDPAALVGPTQEALQKALRALQPINSANAKKMEKDIQEQLRFANIAIVGGMLEPLSLAFNQLRDNADLKQQLERLPGTTAGLIDIFKNMNTQLDDIAKSQNTDVLRQLSAVRGQVEDFGNKIAGTAGQIAESIVTGVIKDFQDSAEGFTATAIQGAVTFDATGAAVQEFDRSLAEQITDFNTEMTKAFQALATLRSTKQTLEGAGLPGGGVGTQIDRLTKAMSENAARVSTQIVSTALGDLSDDLKQVLVQPLAVQATTVNTLFTDSMAALQALWLEWHRLEDAGIDAGPIQKQFERLLGGLLDSTTQVLDTALATGSFSEFLNVLASIPPALTAMNPSLAKLQQMGAVFSQVVNPIAQAIAGLEDGMRTTAERITFTAGRISVLQSAIADVGNSADRALPLLAQLSQAVIENANQQIQAIREIQQAWDAAMSQVASDMTPLEEALFSLDTQLLIAFEALGQSVEKFHAAVNAGDIGAAIKAINAYEQAVLSVAALQIKAIQAQRQAVIDAQQAVIDGIQQQIDAQQDLMDAIQDQIDAQQDIIDRIHDQIDAQQEIIDAYQDQVDAQQDVIDRIHEQIDAQQEIIQAWQDTIRAQEEIIARSREEVRARQDAVDSIKREIDSLTQLRDRVVGITRGGLPPSAEAVSIRGRIAESQARLAGLTGDEAIKELEKLISLNEELKQLGEQTDQLILIKEALNNLTVLEGQLNERLAGKSGELSVAEQQLAAAKATQKAAEDQLAAFQEQLKIQEAVKGRLEDQLKEQEAIKANREAQLKEQQAIKRSLEDQAKEQEKVKKNLDDQLKAQEAVRKNLETQLDDQQKILRNIENSRYWDEQIAAVQAATLRELYNISAWLAGVQGPTTWEDQIRAIQYDSMIRLQNIEAYLRALWLYGIQARQHGGLVGLASGQYYAQHGGMVGVMAEPGERAFLPPLSHAQAGALTAMNSAFPRFGSGGFTVPGSGSGDSVRMAVPDGTFFLNRTGSRAMGFQNGGPVQGNGTPPRREEHRPTVINVDLRGARFSNHEDLKELKRMLEQIRRQHGDTRL